MSRWRRNPEDPRDGEWVKPDELLKWLGLILGFLVLLAIVLTIL